MRTGLPNMHTEKWPDLSEAVVGDIIYYCFDGHGQYNLSQRGIGPAICDVCGNGYRYWKVEPGEKQKQDAYRVFQFTVLSALSNLKREGPVTG